MADAVMRMPEPQLRRQPEEEEEEDLIQTKLLVDQITPFVQRQIGEEEEGEEILQTKKREGTTPEVTNDLESQINAIKGGGRGLGESERAYFEPRFGADFSQVRVHTDTRAAESARAVNAHAFTLGKDVVFGAGEYSEGNSKGQKLMAHELVHVVQQGNQDESTAAVAAAGAPIVQRDLALKPPTPVVGTGPMLSEKEREEAIQYNKSRFQGVEKRVLKTIESVVGKPRERTVVDSVFVSTIARWQSWWNLQSDGKMTPMVARTFASELREEARFPELQEPELKRLFPQESRQRLDTAARILDEQVATGPFRKGAVRQVPSESEWELPVDEKRHLESRSTRN